MLGVGLARSFYLGSVSRSFNRLSEDFIILEDASQQRRPVSMSVCEHFSILEAFRKVHYRGKSGEALVKAGRFSMILGSREGLPARPSDWSIKGRIQVGSTLVMSIHVRTNGDGLGSSTLPAKHGIKRKQTPDNEDNVLNETLVSGNRVDDYVVAS